MLMLMHKQLQQQFPGSGLSRASLPQVVNIQDLFSKTDSLFSSSEKNKKTNKLGDMHKPTSFTSVARIDTQSLELMDFRTQMKRMPS